MLAEGGEPALIETAARMLGMPLGPIELGEKIAKATRATMRQAYPDAAVDAVLFWLADQRRMGKKTKAGFYAYDDAGQRLGLWQGLTAVLASRLPA